MKFILGKKIEMSQMFDEQGNVIPVTLIEAGPCYITQIKTEEKDKYEAVQIGFERLKERKTSSTESGGAGTSAKPKSSSRIKKPQRSKPYRYLREFRAGGQHEQEMKVGDKIDVSVFKEGEKVKVSAVSKGKGFAGGVKKWGFHGQSASHGTKHEERTIGSVGSMFPQRVLKGKKMPGRMGSERITVKNLKIVKTDAENNLLALKGAVPGRRGTLLEIRG